MERERLPFGEILDRLFEAETVSVSLVYRLSDMSPQEMDAFKRRWPQQPDERRGVIARHMADISEENFKVDFSPAFLQLLGDSSAAVRLAALEGLWDTSNLDVVPPIVDLMRDDADVEVRAAAASSLGHFILMGEWEQIDPDVADEIVEALLERYSRDDVEEDVRRAMLESLGNSADRRVPELIEDAYEHGSEGMQLSAIFAMGRSADRRWVPIILREMNSADDESRMEAARAAGNIGDSDAADRLIELLDDDDLEVQLAAVTALGQIGSEQAAEALERMLEDPDADALYDAIEDALDEIHWFGADLDLSLFEWDEDELSA